MLAHGTTVATNALLERRLAGWRWSRRVASPTCIEIARQARPSLYDAHVDRPPPLVPRELRFEVSGRLDAAGGEIEAFDGAVAASPRSATSTRSRCVCCTPISTRAHERAVADVAARPRDRTSVCSHEVSPEFREYERMVTTVADAALRPCAAPYLAAGGRRRRATSW